MVDEQNEHIVIEHFARVDHALLEPIIGGFQDSGISVRVVRDPPGNQGTTGGLAEWDTLVRVVVKVLEAGGTAVAAVVAKDAYGALKRGFKTLWENLYYTSDPGYSPRFSMKLSVVWEFPDGSRLKLLLDPSSQAQGAETALAQFLEIVKLKLDTLHPRSQVEERQFLSEPRNKIEIWVFNPKSNKLEPVDPDVE